MKSTSKLGLSAAVLAALLTTAAIAQQAETPDQRGENAMPGQMMGGGMAGMQGMMPMMQMMQQMGPMMEACTEMMQAMTNQMEAPEPQDG